MGFILGVGERVCDVYVHEERAEAPHDEAEHLPGPQPGDALAVLVHQPRCSRVIDRSCVFIINIWVLKNE